MAVFLSPGVYPREIDQSAFASSTGPLRPVFIGTAKKGPLNTPVRVTTPQQAIDVFGEPFPTSYLMYAVLAALEENSECTVMRVGVEYFEGQEDALADIAIDTSGSKTKGWGRIPIFTGIDYGRIDLRTIDEDNPVTFHAASTSDFTYNDADASSTHGATDAEASVTGTYTGDIDDSFIVVITSAPSTSDGAPVDGAGYQIIRNSDGEVVASGYLSDPDHNSTSEPISIGDGLSVIITVNDGVLDVNDTFTFKVHPDNRDFSVSVEGGAATEYTMPTTTYTSLTTFLAAINALITSEDYILVEYVTDDGDTIPQIRTKTAGERIQLMGSSAWALEMGSQQYSYDIPRSHLLATTAETYDISTQSNRIKLEIIGDSETKTFEFNVPVGNDQTATNLAIPIDAAGVLDGVEYFESFALTAPGGDDHLVIVTSATHQLDTLYLRADYSNLKTLRFAEELDITFPYKRSYRGFSDNRVTLPTPGENDSSVPLSCEDAPLGSDCAEDSAYYAGIVGFLVAPSPGTWVDAYTATLELYTDAFGDSAGRYKLTIKNAAGQSMEAINDISFDPDNARYIANLVNPGTTLGGTNGNSFVNWEDRPSYVGTDEVRNPSQFANKSFSGQANGIPTDATYSSELDSVVIGNPNTGTGLYAFQNPETYDINLLATPGFTTGAVIGTALQICESRGDAIYLVDPPFGLRPRQVMDWHNGMLDSSLSTAINSSYGSLYWSWVKIYDQFNNIEIWIPPSGHVAGAYSRTARDAELWFAPAGLRRGRLLTVRDIEYSPSLGERDLLYGSGNAVNPIVKFPQDGIVIYGQRTLQRTSSALDRVAVRMGMSYIKKNTTDLLRTFIFDPNDSILRRQVLSVLNPFLADIQARRGLVAFKVVCDETNNTEERIARGELWVSILLLFPGTVEFVVLNMSVLRSSGAFSAEEVLAAAGITTLQTAT